MHWKTRGSLDKENFTKQVKFRARKEWIRMESNGMELNGVGGNGIELNKIE